jgi:cell wall-associated NlpC family hydrolase
VKTILFAGVLLFSPLAAAAHTIPIIDGHSSGGTGFVMWSSIDTTIDARSVEQSFSTQYDDAAIERGQGPRYAIARDALRFLGTPFVWGGTTPAGFDCSGFVQHVFAMMNVALPRTADYQFADGRHVSGPLRPGDLVFFHTYAPGASHVGIYLGDGRFVHASRPFVHVSRLRDPYYASRYVGATRPLSS